MSVVDIVLVAVVAPLALTLSLHSVYLLVSSRVERGSSSELRTDRTISVIVPIKNEPVDLVYDSIEHLSRILEDIGSRAGIFIVSDDEEEYAKLLRDRLESLNSPVRVEVIRRGGQGGRVGALNFALKEVVKSDTLIVLDVDAKPSESFFDEMLSCVEVFDVCVGHWVGYWTRDTRIARALSFSTELVTTALYKGRQALGLLIFPLGSGTIFNTNSLRAVGGWEDGTMQDDVIIGMKLHGSGFRVGYSSEASLRVLVPSSYRAFRIQQLKWAYGSLESLRYSFRYVDRGVGVLRSVEARLYTLQYLPGLSMLVASITVPGLAISMNTDPSCFPMLAVGAVSFLYTVAVLATFKKPKTESLRVLKLLGTTSAIGLAVAPVVMKGLILGALGMRLRAPVTPKGSEDREMYREYLEEYSVTAISLFLGITALVKGLYIASLLGFLPAVASVYTLIRATRRPGKIPKHF